LFLGHCKVNQERYKLVLYVEGNLGWANRLATQLAMQSVIIRQFNAPFEEWYSAFLEPWVHYIPVDHLFEELPNVMEWCLNNDDLLLRISKNADRYARKFLSVRTQVRLLELILLEYGRRYERHKDDDSRGVEWVRLEAIQDLSKALIDDEYYQMDWSFN